MKMKSILTRKKNIILLTVSALITMLAVRCGFDALMITTLPASVTANSTFNITLKLNSSVLVAQDSARLVVGFLAPKSWNAAANTTITYTTAKYGVQQMVLIPSNVGNPAYPGKDWPTIMQTLAGIGPNLLPNVKWVAYYGVHSYGLSVGEGGLSPMTINIQTKAGDNTLVKLGFFTGLAQCSNCSLSNSALNIYNYTFSNCFSVTGGKNPLVDFCDPQLTSVSPLEVLDNDIATITFDENVQSTGLDNASQIYLCATGVLSDGTTIPVCVQNSSSMFTSLGGKRWQFQFWPRKYFNLSPGQTLQRVDYYMTNAGGSIKVGINNTSTPFSIPFVCD